jgi:hypothetical protein
LGASGLLSYCCFLCLFLVILDYDRNGEQATIILWEKQLGLFSKWAAAKLRSRWHLAQPIRLTFNTIPFTLPATNFFLWTLENPTPSSQDRETHLEHTSHEIHTRFLDHLLRDFVSPCKCILSFEWEWKSFLAHGSLSGFLFSKYHLFVSPPILNLFFS